MKKAVAIILSLCLILLLCACGAEDTDTASDTDSLEDLYNTDLSDVDVPEGLTYEHFMEVADGMTLSEVNALFGTEGELTGTDETDDGQGQEIYRYGAMPVVVDITFTEGVVSGKAQSGLATTAQAVTLEQFEQISNGMTYDEVVSILGAGVLSSIMYVSNNLTETYTWNGESAEQIAMIMFQDDLVVFSTQYDLD